MEESTSREKVLKKIRDALIDKTDLPYPVLDMESSVFLPVSDSLDVLFAEEFVKAGGKFVYCESVDEFLSNLQSFILQNNWPVVTCPDSLLQQILRDGGIPFESAEGSENKDIIAIHRCEALIARTGSVMLSSQLLSFRKSVPMPQYHLVLAYASQLVPDLKSALQHLRKRYPDRFPADITLITGHELYLFFIDDTPVSGQ